MEISLVKSKILVNILKEHGPANIKINEKSIEEVNIFKNLGSIICSNGSSSKEIKTRLEMASSAVTRLTF